jgi:hypothetical protein
VPGGKVRRGGFAIRRPRLMPHDPECGAQHEISVPVGRTASRGALGS